MNKMFIAIGLDSTQKEIFEDVLPKASPYFQMAYLVFGRNIREATGKARKLLGTKPSIVRQIGGFSTSALGEQRQHDSNTHAVAELHLGDYEDTREGILVNLEELKTRKQAAA